MTNPLTGVRGRVTFTVLAVSAVLFSALGTVGFVQIAGSGRAAIRERIATVLDGLEADVRAHRGTVDVATADGVTAAVLAGGAAVVRTTSDIVVTRDITVGGRAVRLVGRSSQARLTDSLRSLFRGLWIAVPLAALATSLMAGLATHRALRPVGAITALASTVGGRMTADTSRVQVPPSGDEIEHLAVTVNAMLDRIDAGRIAQRRFTSDAAHELRGPLMALQGELELVRTSAQPADDALIGRLEALACRLGERIDDLVLLSTLDEGRPMVRVPTSLVALVRDEASAVPGHPAVAGPDDIVVALDQRLVGRAVANLLANGQRHARSAVAATVAAAGERVWIHVDDDGPGIDPGDRAQVFDRFSRLDEARNTDHGGSGLGLAIVASIAEAHGGGVVAGASASGGARVSLWLPAGETGRATHVDPTRSGLAP